MDAKKCDRCGKLYEEYEKRGSDLLDRLRCERTNSITTVNIDQDGHKSSGQLLDLCPECMEKFLEFWKMEDWEGWIPVTEQLPERGN